MSTQTPATLTRDEVENLNVYATNRTRFHRDEHGMDWDSWTFFPATANEGGRFTDGHDYAGADMIPDEGWVPVNPTVTVPVERLVELLRGLEEASKRTKAHNHNHNRNHNTTVPVKKC